MMRCSRARRRILASRDGRLDLAERLELDRHLASCEACRTLDAADALLEEGLAAQPEPPVEHLDLDVAARAVRGRIDLLERDAAGRRATRVVRWRRLSIAVAAAAVLLVGWSLLDPGEPSSDEREPAVAGGPAAPEAFAEPSEAPPSGPVVPPDEQVLQVAAAPELELERLEKARAAVRDAFALAVEAVPGTPETPGILDARLAATVEPLSGLVREGWPITRLAERVVTDADAGVAVLATRWLGREGDRLSIGTIASLLRRPDVSGAQKEQVVLALLDDGKPGIEALAPALNEVELRPLALEGLVARGGIDASRLVEEALGDTRDDPESAIVLAQALAQMGEPGLEALLRAVTLRGAAAEAALAQLRRTRGASDRLAASLGERGPARELDARLLAAARLGLAEALPRLRDRALERARREAALEGLAVFEGPGALGVVLDLWEMGRIGTDELSEVARVQLERDPRQAVLLCEQIETQGPGPERLAHLLDLLLATESPSSAPALARLADSTRLERDERQWAALALAGLGTDAEARSLAATLQRIGPDDARLAAACAFSLHAISGASALRAVLGPSAEVRADRLLALYERRSTDRIQAVILSRASRLLEPWLDSLHPERTRTTP